MLANRMHWPAPWVPPPTPLLALAEPRQQGLIRVAISRQAELRLRLANGLA